MTRNINRQKSTEEPTYKTSEIDQLKHARCVNPNISCQAWNPATPDEIVTCRNCGYKFKAVKNS